MPVSKPRVNNQDTASKTETWKRRKKKGKTSPVANSNCNHKLSICRASSPFSPPCRPKPATARQAAPEVATESLHLSPSPLIGTTIRPIQGLRGLLPNSPNWFRFSPLIPHPAGQYHCLIVTAFDPQSSSMTGSAASLAAPVCPVSGVVSAQLIFISALPVCLQGPTGACQGLQRTRQL